MGSPVGYGSQDLIQSVYYLTEADLVAAFWKLVENEPKVVGGMVHGYFQNAVKNATPEDGVDAGWIDATAADCLVQIAAFGHVVFG